MLSIYLTGLVKPLENILSASYRIFEPIDARSSFVLKHFDSLKIGTYLTWVHLRSFILFN